MCYFYPMLEHPEEVAQTVAHALGDPVFGAVDTIVGTGMSGCMILLPIKILTGLHVVAVRKDTNQSHSNSIFETSIAYPQKACSRNPRYVLVDDFINSGNTVRDAIAKLPSTWICTGIILYNATGTDGQVFKGLNGVDDIPVRSVYQEVVEVLNMKGKKNTIWF